MRRDTMHPPSFSYFHLIESTRRRRRRRRRRQLLCSNVPGDCIIHFLLCFCSQFQSGRKKMDFTFFCSHLIFIKFESFRLTFNNWKFSWWADHWSKIQSYSSRLRHHQQQHQVWEGSSRGSSFISSEETRSLVISRTRLLHSKEWKKHFSLFSSTLSYEEFFLIFFNVTMRNP